MLSHLPDGVYSLSYRFPADAEVGATGLAIVRNSDIFGSDAAGGVFKARQNRRTGEVRGTISLPPDGEMITGQRAGPQGMDIDVKAAPMAGSEGLCFVVDLAGSQVAIEASYVGPLPAGLPTAAELARS
jgi:hypothetical protein